MRLTKLLLALAVVAGSLFAFSPDASAHRNTGSVAAVAGSVAWNCPAGGPNGLPIGDPATQKAYTTPDCKFNFTTLQINSVGLWDGMNQKTVFTCTTPTGSTGASGNDKGTPLQAQPDTQQVALGTTFGAFRGTFACDGATAGAGYNLPGSIGSFQGLSLGGTTIGFLGTIDCKAAGAGGAVNGTTCPLGPGTPAGNQPTLNGGNYTSLTANPAGTVTPAGWGAVDHNVTALSHTVACKGEVVPVLAVGYFTATDVFATAGQVALNCVIA